MLGCRREYCTIQSGQSLPVVLRPETQCLYNDNLEKLTKYSVLSTNHASVLCTLYITIECNHIQTVTRDIKGDI